MSADTSLGSSVGTRGYYVVPIGLLFQRETLDKKPAVFAGHLLSISNPVRNVIGSMPPLTWRPNT